MRVLVVNAGSSSLKLALLDPEHRLATRTVEAWTGADHLEPIEEFLADLDGVADIEAIGHRVVHGGPRYAGATLIDDDVVTDLESISDLAPLHNPRAVAGIRAVRRLLPDLPAVAAFDTAFHAGLPAAARTYALPREWNTRFALRRYGFHGLSHGYAVRRAAALVGRPVEDLRIVSCHLGAGGSLAAVREGRSVDTTMGFTPLAGLVMQTRSGSIDPGLLLWLLQHAGADLADLTRVLEHESGLKGLSGTSGDLREVLAARAAGDPDAALAFDVYVHRLVREIGAMAASAGGLDVLVFTGGVGEHSPDVRAGVAARLGHLGVAIRADRNDAVVEGELSAPGAAVRTVVVTAAEDVEIARQTRERLDDLRRPG
ncbi:acetate/propionate family kinase [Nocardioides daeguensis]|uniref:Acetate kinase n=1 Tax=Nocardioides daeguensis TaxID=908359 RepID=A0ABP6UQS6_9ACTN|nr:acetate/propionate family kinase [Nocardioides daeguensis]MBV6728278.1 acetate/propionate family kinase [Nocardioides daeguensis]MCR1773087.1 acetate/propionate family kinase [Nocardioides daeguensis]